MLPQLRYFLAAIPLAFILTLWVYSHPRGFRYPASPDQPGIRLNSYRGQFSFAFHSRHWGDPLNLGFFPVGAFEQSNVYLPGFHWQYTAIGTTHTRLKAGEFWSINLGLHYSIVTFCSIIPVAIAVIRYLRTRKSRRGVCPTCSYDLRGHKLGERCPECGTVVLAEGEAER